MVSIKSTLSTAALLVAAALPVQAVYRINNPVAGTVWQAGQTVTIGWYDDNSPAVAAGTPVTLYLYSNSGNNSNDMENLQTINTVAGSAQSTTFTVPSTLVNGAGYSVAIGYSGVEPQYSHFFSVAGGRAEGSPSDSAQDTTTNAAPSASATATVTSTDATSVATATSVTTVTSSASRSSASSTSSRSASSTRSASSASASSSSSKAAAPSTASEDDAESGAASSGHTALGLGAIAAVAFSLVARA
ncbi:hypothetical protein IWQ60_001756 [Tieghemiomyces parasiticus]|uniref:Yeast cell wall synthesis Kre9/Knh1-like N-terminal domain-containing protein n=1 Tax=Tieghemiomyces parasiticus TaxID=78921 RepID=A0A9W8ADZ7_9FUNG|nr:hypothetical protein IWQ60_001756 [Tieghemiomyces parasiticus]